MKTRNVLIVTYYWPPSGGSGVQRFLKFCKYLPRFGVTPTVLTVSNPTYPIIDRSLSEEVPEEVNVYRSRSYEPFQLYAKLSGKSTSEASKPTQALRSNKWSARMASWIRANIFIPDARYGWVFTARRKALKVIQKENIDAIITTGPPHSTHFIGKYVNRKTGIRWIADFRDPWSHVYYNQVLPRTRPALYIDRKLERSVLTKADEVIVVSPSMRKIQRTIYDRRYHMIPNGFDPEDFQQSPDELTPYHDHRFTIRFTGSVREAAIPSGMFKAISMLSEPDKVLLEFIGNVHPKVREQIKKFGIASSVSIQSYIPHKEVVKAMRASDLLLLSISKTEHSELILTGKLFDYLGSGTPILFMGTTSGDAAHIIQETGQGVCFEHDDAESIRTYLEKVIRDPDQLPRSNIQSSLTDHPYSRITLTSQLIDVIKP